MVDKSWGVTGTPGVSIRTNDSLEQRAAERARARAARADDSAAAMPDRLTARALAREAEQRDREAARTARREQEAALTARDPHTAAAQRHRGSGRRDVVREDRDTSGYAMNVDPGRIRALAGRGATASSLAAVFNVPIEDIERVLAATD